MQRFSALFLVSLAACTDGLGTTPQALTAERLQPLVVDGLRTTGVSYGLTEPPESDVNPPDPDTDPPQPALGMLFAPVDKLERTVDVTQIAGGRTLHLTDPPGPDLTMSVLGRDGTPAARITVEPPEPDHLTDPPSPDHVVIAVRLQPSGTVAVVDASGRLLGNLGGRAASTAGSAGPHASKLQPLVVDGLRATGVSYGLAEPPNPDADPPNPDTDPPSPDLGLVVAPIAGLERVLEPTGVAGGRSVQLLMHAAEPPSPDLEMSLRDRQGALAATVTVDPPGPDHATDPPGPDRVALQVRLQKGASIVVYDATGRMIGTLAPR